VGSRVEEALLRGGKREAQRQERRAVMVTDMSGLSFRVV
jgi:hypothetical protein